MPQKRKRTDTPDDNSTKQKNQQKQRTPQKQKQQQKQETQQQKQKQSRSSPTRRATRQTPVYPPSVPGPSAKTAPVPPTTTPVPLPVFPGQTSAQPTKRGRGRPKSSGSGASGGASAPVGQSATATGAMGSVPTMGVNLNVNGTGKLGKENVRPVEWVAPETPYRTTQQTFSRPSSGAARPTVSAPVMSATSPVVPSNMQTQTAAEKPAVRSDRNIDKVVLGKLCFRTWYPSYYGKEVLGDTTGNIRAATIKDGILDAAKPQTSSQSQSQSSSTTTKKDKDNQLVLERLYVCPSCFKYAKEIVAWWGHVSACEKKGHVPGTKVYSHPRGKRKIFVAQDGSKASAPGPKKRRGEGGVKYTEQVVQDNGEWSIWEVDGEVDGLFCQNLSLFAKLFLDNKSVFFDVTGFNYFLLVYTPPAKPEDEAPPIPQITGFFSKEKMSWDNNNLACILVFPPWQRKGLGALLMGASYEISRREGVLGGPEKPISDLGKKGYKRFWAGEIARWLLSLDANSVPTTAEGELVVDIDDISQGTWISPEDCLGVLREMGLVEEAGLGAGKPSPKPEPSDEADEEDADAEDKSQVKVEAEEEKKSKGSKAASNASKKKVPANASGSTAAAAAAANTTSSSSSPAPVKLVKRVKVDKEAIRQYVIQHRISLEKSCDSAGFVEGYAIKEEGDGMSVDSQSGE